MKPGSLRALEGLQPASALTKATADGYCQFQDEINTTDQDLRELRKQGDGDKGRDDRYFEEGSIRFGLFSGDFGDDDKNRKDLSAQIVQKINFFGHEGPDDKDCELRSQKNSTSDEVAARIVEVAQRNGQ